MDEELKNMVGKRVLVHIGVAAKVAGRLTEVKILEVSPSGEHLKLQVYRSDGSTFVEWERSRDVDLVEVLD